MIPIMNAEQNKKADAYTILNEPILSINLMERAANNCFNKILPLLNKNTEVYCIAGIGNNGGDVIALARILHLKGFKTILYIIQGKFSEDNLTNQQRFKKLGLSINYIHDESIAMDINSKGIIIEGLFGSGLSRPASGIYSKVISFINNLSNKVISIDIPSGLLSEDNAIAYEDKRPDKMKFIHADYTFSIEAPFLSMLQPENFKFVGDFNIVSIGLDKTYISNLNPKYFLLEKEDFKSILATRGKFSHKGNFGHALLISGHKGSFGAAILSAKAALKSGLGLLSVHLPSSGLIALQTAVPEAMLSLDKNDDFISEVNNFNQYNAIGIGPGIGTSPEICEIVFHLIQECSKPVILDADALNCLAKRHDFLKHLKQNSILSPHVKEFDRMFGKHLTNYERIKTQQRISIEYKIIIILKGAHTSISVPSGKVYFNTTGNAGMATAGSGDVLTGIILGLLSSSYSSVNAALLGVFIHGLAGDFALETESMETLLASDIIYNLSKAFKLLHNLS